MPPARRGNDVYEDSGTPDERIVPVTNVILSADTCPPDYGSSAAANSDLKLALVGEPAYKVARDYRTCGGSSFLGASPRDSKRAQSTVPVLTTPHRRLPRIVIRGTRVIAPGFKPDLPTNLPKIQYARARREERAASVGSSYGRQLITPLIRLLLGTLRASRIVVVVDGATIRHTERRFANTFIGKIRRLLRSIRVWMSYLTVRYKLKENSRSANF